MRFGSWKGEQEQDEHEEKEEYQVADEEEAKGGELDEPDGRVAEVEPEGAKCHVRAVEEQSDRDDMYIRAC